MSGPRTDAGAHRGAHAVEFSKTAAPLLQEGTPPYEAPGPAQMGPPSGQQSLAHPPGVSNPRGRASVSAAARNCSTRSDEAKAAEAPLADLQHAAVQLASREVEHV